MGHCPCCRRHPSILCPLFRCLKRLGSKRLGRTPAVTLRGHSAAKTVKISVHGCRVRSHPAHRRQRKPAVAISHAGFGTVWQKSQQLFRQRPARSRRHTCRHAQGVEVEVALVLVRVQRTARPCTQIACCIRVLQNKGRGGLRPCRYVDGNRFKSGSPQAGCNDLDIGATAPGSMEWLRWPPYCPAPGKNGEVTGPWMAGQSICTRGCTANFYALQKRATVRAASASRLSCKARAKEFSFSSQRGLGTGEAVNGPARRSCWKNGRRVAWPGHCHRTGRAASCILCCIDTHPAVGGAACALEVPPDCARQVTCCGNGIDGLALADIDFLGPMRDFGTGVSPLPA